MTHASYVSILDRFARSFVTKRKSPPNRALRPPLSKPSNVLDALRRNRNGLLGVVEKPVHKIDDLLRSARLAGSTTHLIV